MVIARSDTTRQSQCYRNILIIKPSSLGDIIHALPVLPLLRKGHPEARLSWLVKEEWAEVLKGNPYLDEVISAPFSVQGFLTLIPSLRKRRFDLVIDLQGLFRTGCVSYLTGAPTRIGFENAREGSPLFYTMRVPVPDEDIHAVDRYLLVTQAIGLEGTAEAFPLGPLLGDGESFVRGFFTQHHIADGTTVIAVHPSARWPTKRWPAERFAALVDVLNRRERTVVVFIGSSDDCGVVNKITSCMTTTPLSSAGQTSLSQVAALLKKADLLLTNDSGPMHIAAAVGTPVVALFGPTDPRRTGPYGKGHTVLKKDLFCSPCFSRRCANPDQLACMTSIGMEEVLDAIDERLRR